MIRTIYSFLFLISFGWTQSVLGSGFHYPNSVHFQNLLKEQDISIGEIEAITQCSEGFLWFGGFDGVLRYDGYEFTPVLATRTDESETPESIEQVIDIYEDSNKTLWVGARHGLFKLDRNTNIFREYRFSIPHVESVFGQGANKIKEAPSGELLVASLTGVVAIDTSLNKIDILTFDEEQTGSTASVDEFVNDVAIDEQGIIWVGSNKGLIRYDLENKQSKRFYPHKLLSKSLPHNSVRTMTFDREGNLWLGTSIGLYRYSQNTNKFKHYTHHADKDSTISSNIIRKVYTDKQGILWIGTDGGGLSLYRHDRDEFLRFKTGTGQRSQLNFDSVRTIFEDNVGDLWVGTHPTGINHFNRGDAYLSFYQKEEHSNIGLNNTSVLSVQEDKYGNLWLGTDGGGLNYFNRQTGKFSYHLHSPNNSQSIGGPDVVSLLVDSQNTLWSGSWNSGLNRFDTNTNSFIRYPFDESLIGSGTKTSKALQCAHIWSIIEDHKGNLWLGCHDGGLNHFNRKTETFTNYSYLSGDPLSLSNNLVWRVYEDSKHRLWIGTVHGLNRMDKEIGKFRRYMNSDSPGEISHNSIVSIYEDSKSRMWFGTNDGLNLLDEDTHEFTVFSIKDGFEGNNIHSITEDKTGNLWLGTNIGVTRFNYEKNEIENFNKVGAHRFGGINRGAGLVSQRDEIIFGSVNGLSIIDVKNIKKNSLPPPIVLNDLKLFTKNIEVGGQDNLLSRVLNHTDEITFNYDMTMFSIGFSALNFRLPEKNRYAYKLEGFDEDWREIGLQRNALYTNLDAGTYEFKVKASNSDGVWNERSKVLVIKQLPPPWRTWWAYAIYSILVTSFIVRIFYLQHKKRLSIEEQNRLLEAKVAERTLALKQKNDDIQAMLSNMKQGLFTINSDNKIQDEYSQYLSTIFETENIEHRNIIDFLFSNSKLRDEQISRVDAAISAIMETDVFNYELNAHLLLDEYITEFGNQKKILTLDWNPILADSIVVKLMVTVRDVTKLRQVELEAKRQQRELDIVDNLLKSTPARFLKFEEQVRNFLEQNRALINNTTKISSSVFRQLFRDAHTLKGDSRTLGYETITNFIHDLETVYNKKDSDTLTSNNNLKKHLGSLEREVANYNHVCKKLLSAVEHSQHKNENGKWMSSDLLSSIRAGLDLLKIHKPDAYHANNLADITQQIDEALWLPLDEILKDIIISLPETANYLQKKSPLINIDLGDLRFAVSHRDFLKNIFGHLFNNCLDHGIEKPDYRVKLGKDPRGTITISQQKSVNDFCISIKDDGAGLDLAKLKNRYIVKHPQKSSQDQDIDLSTLTQQIFEQGVSTKEQTTQISGRGVGLDAVKSYLLKGGGDIDVLLLEEANNNNTAQFELIISLPNNICIEASQDERGAKN